MVARLSKYFFNIKQNIQYKLKIYNINSESNLLKSTWASSSLVYDDSWTALKWVASHDNGDGPEEWLNSHADFSKVFFSGDRAGANISHHMAMRHGQDKLVV
jgi:hypothetical protein